MKSLLRKSEVKPENRPDDPRVKRIAEAEKRLRILEAQAAVLRRDHA